MDYSNAYPYLQNMPNTNMQNAYPYPQQQYYQQQIPQQAPVQYANSIRQTAPAQTNSNVPKYPTQLANIERKDFTLYAEGVFEQPKFEDYIKGTPLLDVANKYAVDFFIFKPDEKKSLKYRVSFKETKYFLEASKSCIIAEEVAKRFGGNTNSINNNGIDMNSAAFKTPMKGKKYAGKTAVQILLENPQTGVTDLQTQYNYLAQNLTGQYAVSNKQQMAAIAEALTLYSQGKLTEVAAGISSETIIEDGLKTPAKNNVDAMGNTQVRIIQIKYLNGKFKLTLMNCMAPPIPNAKVGAYMSKAVNKQEYSFEMSPKEWFCFLQEIITIGDAIIIENTPAVLELYQKHRWIPKQK